MNLRRIARRSLDFRPTHSPLRDSGTPGWGYVWIVGVADADMHADIDTEVPPAPPPTLSRYHFSTSTLPRLAPMTYPSPALFPTAFSQSLPLHLLQNETKVPGNGLMAISPQRTSMLLPHLDVASLPPLPMLHIASIIPHLDYYHPRLWWCCLYHLLEHLLHHRHSTGPQYPCCRCRPPGPRELGLSRWRGMLYVTSPSPGKIFSFVFVFRQQFTLRKHSWRTVIFRKLSRIGMDGHRKERRLSWKL